MECIYASMQSTYFIFDTEKKCIVQETMPFFIRFEEEKKKKAKTKCSVTFSMTFDLHFVK